MLMRRLGLGTRLADVLLGSGCRAKCCTGVCGCHKTPKDALCVEAAACPSGSMRTGGEPASTPWPTDALPVGPFGISTLPFGSVGSLPIGAFRADIRLTGTFPIGNTATGAAAAAGLVGFGAGGVM